VIPAALFLAWVRDGAALDAASQLRAISAVQVGTAAAHDPKQLGVRKTMLALRDAMEDAS
jgi:hypothetical protein